MFNKRLAKKRKERKITQKQMAHLLGITEAGYAHWEQGRNEPPINMLNKICRILNIKSDYLIGLEDELGNKIDQNDTPKVEEKKETKLIEVPIATRSRGNKIPLKTYFMTEEQLDELVNRIRDKI